MVRIHQGALVTHRLLSQSPPATVRFFHALEPWHDWLPRELPPPQALGSEPFTRSSPELRGVYTTAV